MSMYQELLEKERNEKEMYKDRLEMKLTALEKGNESLCSKVKSQLNKLSQTLKQDK